MMKYEITYKYGSSDDYWDQEDTITLEASSLTEIIENFHTYCRILKRYVKEVSSMVLIG